MDSDLCRSHKLSELVSEISEGGKNMPVEFKGNCPKNVNKDAKYTVRSHNGQYVVGITYQSDNGERWFPFTQEHAANVFLRFTRSIALFHIDHVVPSLRVDRVCWSQSVLRYRK